ncbi:MAG: hypothetical protein JSU61_12675 [Fidelibacterota bacterium]|nr:MAG: hypothetical protein JSU61_12675 [Candidatus Neomarinimicrobiota bacterium]
MRSRYNGLLPKPQLLTMLCLPVLIMGSEMTVQPWRFDMGPADSEIAVRMAELTPEDMYMPERGFGWLTVPVRTLRDDTWSRSRDALTIDGVAGKELVFKIDLPEGTWGITAWFNAGMEDSSTLIITANKHQISPVWQAFNPPAEGRTNPLVNYRVYHQLLTLDKAGLELAFRSQSDEVQLLGLSLIPYAEPISTSQVSFLNHLKQLGTYGQHLALDQMVADGEGPDRLRPLLVELEDDPGADESNSFAAYWNEQLSILIQAEDLLRMMGWEWANTEVGLGLFDRYFQIVMLLDGLLGYAEAQDNPLYERALFHRARMLYWLDLERGGPWEASSASRDIQALAHLYPDDQLLTMYSGAMVEVPSVCDVLQPTSGAPDWSHSQRQVLCRMRDEIEWWVDERQAENGEFGGKIGDDVELLRWWSPLLAAGDLEAREGWRKLADAAWSSPKVHAGYSRRPLDVEHASEYISDTAPELALYLDDPLYVDRLRYSTDYFLGPWTTVTEEGYRYFKSAWFSSTEVDARPPRDRDLEMNTRAVKTVRYLAFITGDEAVTRALEAWSLGWVAAAMKTDKGKPLGIIPASYRASDGAINGDEANWFEANMYWNYFDWDHNHGTMLMDQLLFTYILTGNEELLSPITLSLELVHDLVQAEREHGRPAYPPGTVEWAALELLESDDFWNVVECWRLETEDDRFDDLITRFGSSYARYRITGDERQLVAGLEPLLDQLRHNRPLRTTEVLHTDRVYMPGHDHLKAMLTGSGASEGASPFGHVTWEDTDRNFTALVTDAHQQALAVDLFSHSRRKVKITARLWRLDPGVYRLSLHRENKKTKSQLIEISNRGQRIGITLPGRELVHLRIEPL